MATIQGFTPTPNLSETPSETPSENLDQKLTLHVWSRAAFATGLLPALAAAPHPVVLSVLSAGVHSPYRNYASDPELSEKAGATNYSIKNAANAAGFYNDIFLDALAEENGDVTYVHAAPGLVDTRWGAEMPAWLRWGVRAAQWAFAKPKEDAAEYLVAGGLSETLRGRGRVVLLDQYGREGPKVTALHEEAKAEVAKHVREVVKRGRSVAAA
eukprot:1189117-Prorocentrum_minimum.AAC.1